MKIIVEQASGNKRVVMKTSERGLYYSIKFHQEGKYDHYAFLNWGHLNVRQAKIMVKELEWFIKRNKQGE